jgi:hypothetical protein
MLDELLKSGIVALGETLKVAYISLRVFDRAS